MYPIILLLLSLFCAASSSIALDDSGAIMSLIQSVYKEKSLHFVKLQQNKNYNQVLKYYNKYFTADLAELITKAVNGVNIRPGDFLSGEDPRYSDSLLTGDPEEPFYGDQDRKIEKMTFNNPIITRDTAYVYVDSIVASKYGLEMRTKFYLVKSQTGWKISNITWGPKGNFEENTTQGLRTIF